MKIQDNAIVKLVMVAGSLVSDAELRDKILAYNYFEDPDDPCAFNLMTHGGYISFDRDGEIFNVYAEADADIEEHAQNLNNILLKAGWTEYDIYAVNPEVTNDFIRHFGIDVRDIWAGAEAQLTPAARVASVDKHDTDVEDMPTAHASTSAVDIIAEPNESLGAAEAELGNADLLEAQARVQELEIEVSAARAENVRLASQLEAAKTQIRQFQTVPDIAVRAIAPSVVTTEAQVASPLHAVVQKHIGELIDFNFDGPKFSLLRELRAAGYGFRVCLVEPVA